ncbi:hypothetical protein PanWU01x14_212900 [Parasponia andersonii]|uniref:Uncharacterized protein n=1 Tax=Parasponia andersonii TaxID=3476 RepID=A0A2P5BSU0_PARAD|nr:hypothetical protein PanWU01x14_212900 [Parasponia andersonii]
MLMVLILLNLIIIIIILIMMIMIVHPQALPEHLLQCVLVLAGVFEIIHHVASQWVYCATRDGSSSIIALDRVFEIAEDAERGFPEPGFGRGGLRRHLLRDLRWVRLAADGRDQIAKGLVHVEKLEELLGRALRQHHGLREVEKLDDEGARHVGEEALGDGGVVGEDGVAELLLVGEEDGGALLDNGDPRGDLSLERFPLHALHVVNADVVVAELLECPFERGPPRDGVSHTALGVVPGFDHGFRDLVQLRDRFG